jgi:hypothetical protein
VHEQRRVAGPGVGETTFLQAGDDLGAQYARGLEQQPRQVGFAHGRIVVVGRSNVNLVDRRDGGTLER